MGFYPVTPGLPAYTIGSPLFGEATIQVVNNKKFTVKANHNSTENKYIQSATLNGQPFNRTWIGHDEIIKGGELVFEMGPVPNKKWGTALSGMPYSMTGK
jgi:putative alpha-1,2-mannosidase